MPMLRKIAKGFGILVAVVVLLVAGYLGYASATAEKRLSFPDTPYPKITSSKDAAIVERGRYLVHGPAHCSQCHSVDDRNKAELIVQDVPLTGGLLFAMGPLANLYGPNLTPDPETGLGKRSDADIARTIRSGILHDGQFSFMMRFAAARLSDDDLTAVVSYLRSLPPVRREVPRAEWKLVGKALLPMFPLGPRPVEGPTGVQAGAEPSVERGAYLAENVVLCVGCHSQVDQKTFEPVGPKAGGGAPEASHGDDSDMEFVTPNLTADAETGYTGRSDEQSFVTRMRAGRAIKSSIMPWEGIKQMTDNDLRSVYRYLRSLPPVRNEVGPTYRKVGWKRPT